MNALDAYIEASRACNLSPTPINAAERQRTFARFGAYFLQQVDQAIMDHKHYYHDGES